MLKYSDMKILENESSRAEIIGLAARRTRNSPNAGLQSASRDNILAAMGVFLKEHADRRPENPTVTVLNKSTNFVRLPARRRS